MLYEQQKKEHASEEMFRRRVAHQVKKIREQENAHDEDEERDLFEQYGVRVK